MRIYFKISYFSFKHQNQPINVVQYGNQLVLNVAIYQGSTSIISQYQMAFNSNGTAKFQTLGFYNEANNVIISYNLMGQQGLNM